jgi:hypothetical protein
MTSKDGEVKMIVYIDKEELAALFSTHGQCGGSVDEE